ncbi:MAG TPA: tetratricopeptide repeat protein [Candidatus Acidoferrales bacterium]|nr:tetratricopeptide repeat protein [Candidatus Acidoferrales bacterium]
MAPVTVGLTVPALLLGCLAMGRAEQPCARCHASEVAAFERSPMGRSVGPPSVFAEGRIVHKLSGSTITIHQRGSVLEHGLEERGVVAKYPIAYSVGAGIVGYSYMVRLRQYLFQSPASYYTQTKSWDLTPGYETEPHLDFTHQISSGCLFCHTGSVNLIGGTANQFGDPPFTPISCDRCHGSPAAHLKNPVAGSIVNPARLLTPSSRDSVCEQCHLEGEVRILNPGRDWWDFQAGQATESVFVTYLRTAAPGTLRAVSQSELLARSQCARQSGGRFWCGTCHNPHGDQQNRAQALRQVCLSCHSDLFAARGRPAGVAHHRAAAECVSCHMPRLRPTNVAHSAITDHSIPRLPRAAQPERGGDNPQPKAWREPDAAVVRRDLGLAYFDLAASTHAAPDLQQAYQILSQLPPQTRQDPAVEADLGSVLLAEGEAQLAVQMFARASAQEPSNARYLYCLGAALERAGKIEEAVKDLKRCIELDPSQPDPYLELAQVYKKAGREAESRSELREYLKFMPQNIQLR